MTRRKTRNIGRDAGTGRFISVEDARKNPEHTVVERVKNPEKKGGCKKK